MNGEDGTRRGGVAGGETGVSAGATERVGAAAQPPGLRLLEIAADGAAAARVPLKPSAGRGAAKLPKPEAAGTGASDGACNIWRNWSCRASWAFC